MGSSAWSWEFWPPSKITGFNRNGNSPQGAEIAYGIFAELDGTARDWACGRIDQPQHSKPQGQRISAKINSMIQRPGYWKHTLGEIL